MDWYLGLLFDENFFLLAMKLSRILHCILLLTQRFGDYESDGRIVETVEQWQRTFLTLEPTLQFNPFLPFDVNLFCSLSGRNFMSINLRIKHSGTVNLSQRKFF